MAEGEGFGLDRGFENTGISEFLGKNDAVQPARSSRIAARTPVILPAHRELETFKARA
jgi:hypothetical protein